jgi:hypothetical protein
MRKRRRKNLMKEKTKSYSFQFHSPLPYHYKRSMQILSVKRINTTYLKKRRKCVEVHPFPFYHTWTTKYSPLPSLLIDVAPTITVFTSSPSPSPLNLKCVCKRKCRVCTGHLLPRRARELPSVHHRPPEKQQRTVFRHRQGRTPARVRVRVCVRVQARAGV